MKQQTIGIIICTRNRLSDLIKCLHTIATQIMQPDQLIIIDSSTTPLSKNSQFGEYFSKKFFPTVDVIYKHTKPGLTFQRNQGIKLLKTELTFFFDDDVILAPDYLHHMHDIFCKNSKYMGGMGSIQNMAPFKRNIFRLYRKLFLLQHDYATGYFTASGMPTHAYGNKLLQEVHVLGGCCMAFRSAIFKEFMFDENLPLYGAMEDVDFSWRVSRKHTFFFNPAAKLEHHNSPLNREKIFDAATMYMQHYRYLFFKNVYPENRCKLVAHWWSIIGLLVQTLVFHRNWDSFKGYLHGLFVQQISDKK